MKRAKARILIVEDDQAILKGLSDVLVFNGYAVEGLAEGGEERRELVIRKAIQTLAVPHCAQCHGGPSAAQPRCRL